MSLTNILFGKLKLNLVTARVHIKFELGIYHNVKFVCVK